MLLCYNRSSQCRAECSPCHAALQTQGVGWQSQCKGLRRCVPQRSDGQGVGQVAWVLVWLGVVAEVQLSHVLAPHLGPAVLGHVVHCRGVGAWANEHLILSGQRG